jgi:hypothetical protein
MLSLHSVPVKVAKYIKIPFRAGVEASRYVVLGCFRQFISGRQTAYLISSSHGTLFFYKKNDTIVEYNFPNEIDCSNIFVISVPEKEDFIIYHSNKSDSSSRAIKYNIIGPDSAPYRIIIEKSPLKRSESHTYTYEGEDIETKITIVKITTEERILELSLNGQISIGYPLYNNYIPIMNLANKKIMILVIDIVNRKVITVLKTWLKTMLEKLDNLKEIDKKIIQGQYRDYRLSEADFKTDNNYTINKCTFYVRYHDLTGSITVFSVEIGIEKEAMYYKIIVPKQVRTIGPGISETSGDYTVESQVLRLALVHKGFTKTNVLYQDKRYAILKPPSPEAKYYIVNSEGHIDHVIDSHVDCGNTENTRHLFDVYFAEGFIIILHKSGILLYNILKGQWRQVEISDGKDKIDFCNLTHEYYYINKCQKLVFVLLDKSVGFDGCIIIDLKLAESNNENYIVRLSESQIRHDEVIPYVENTYGDFYSNTYVSFYDYSLDANRAVLYLSYILENHRIKHITMECDLCSNTYRWKEFRIDVPLRWDERPDTNVDSPIYISRRHLAMKGIPKYLPIYSMQNLYDVITNKISHYGLIVRKRITGMEIVENQYRKSGKQIPLISLHVIDSDCNRTITLFSKIAVFTKWDWGGKIFIKSPYQDIVGIYNLLEGQMHNLIYTIGIMVISELAIVANVNRNELPRLI